MKPLQARHAWDGGVKLQEERTSDADTCRILVCAGGSSCPKEKGLPTVLCLLPKFPRAMNISESVPAVIATLRFLAGCSAGLLLSCPSAFHVPSKSNMMHTMADSHR